MSHATVEPQAGDLWSGGVKPYKMDSKKFGMWLFIASDSITFAALLMAYSYVRLSAPWPEELPFTFSSIMLSSVMTFCLLSSSLTMVFAVAASAKGDRDKTFNWLMATVVGGLAFVVLHGYEWMHIIHDQHLFMYAPEGASLPGIWATFFCCTGMHMLHVTIGVAYLFGLAVQYKGGKFKPIDVEVAGLYWHFVDLVWMFVFPLIYLMSADMKGLG